MYSNFLNRLLYGFVLINASIFLYYTIAHPRLLHPENFMYFQYYIERNGLVEELLKPFNTCRVDACIDRFRPVSHLLSYFDANFDHLIQSKYFWSPTQIIVTILISIITYKFLVSIGSNSTALSIYLSSIILVSPILNFASTMNFRPAKILSSFVLTYLIYYWSNVKKLTLSSAFLIIFLAFTDEMSVMLCMIYLVFFIFSNLKNREQINLGILLLLTILLIKFVISTAIFSYFSPNIDFSFSSVGNIKVDALYINSKFIPWINELYLNSLYPGLAQALPVVNESVTLFIFFTVIITVLIYFSFPFRISLFIVAIQYALLFYYFIAGIKHYPILDKGSTVIGYYSGPFFVFFHLVYSGLIVCKYKKNKVLGVILLIFFATSQYSSQKLYYSQYNDIAGEYLSIDPNSEFWAQSRYVREILSKNLVRIDDEPKSVKLFLDKFLK